MGGLTVEAGNTIDESILTSKKTSLKKEIDRLGKLARLRSSQRKSFELVQHVKRLKIKWKEGSYEGEE